MAVVHFTFITLILLSMYAMYGALYKDFAKRSYEQLEKHFSLFLFLFPSKIQTYTKFYKSLVVFTFIALLLVEILLILGYIRLK